MPASRWNCTTPETHDAPTWKHGDVAVIGLIGAIGGGKSRVAAALADRGALVVDADSMGHRLLLEPAIRARVLDRFGDRILASDCEGGQAGGSIPIDRKTLGKIVFSDPIALRDLESILHPEMKREFGRIIEHALSDDSTLAIVLDAAILLEAGWHDLCDILVFVDAPRSMRLERVRKQRGWSAETLAAREQAQWPLEQKKDYSDFVIMNDSGMDGLEQEVDRLWSRLRCRGGHPRDDVKIGLGA